MKLPLPRSASALDVEQLRLLAHWSGDMPKMWWIPKNAPPRDAQFVLDIWHWYASDKPLQSEWTAAARRADRRSAMRKVFADDT